MTLTDYLTQYQGHLVVDGTQVSAFTPSMLSATIRLCPNSVKPSVQEPVPEPVPVQEVPHKTVMITVKQYMTKPATPEFDFMQKFNNNTPMPLCTMVGTIEKETKGMYYMRLHGDTTGKPVQRCLKCGRVITNPVSQYFGLGVECGGHNYKNPFDTEQELQDAVAVYRREVLQKMTWEGWVIKSAIKEKVVL